MTIKVPADLRQQCTAKAKRTQRRCRNQAEPGREVCRYHGGLTPAGIEHPSFKDGKYSRDLPSRLLERYEASLIDNEDKLDLRDEVAVMESRIADMMQRADQGEGARLWKELRKNWQRFADARNRQDGANMARHLNEVGLLIQRGMEDAAAWKEIEALVERKRKLVETQARIDAHEEDWVRVEQVLVLVTTMLSLVNTHVVDVKARNALRSGLRRLMMTDNAQTVYEGKATYRGQD